MAPSSPSTTERLAVSKARFPTPNRLEFDIQALTSENFTVWFEANVPVAQTGAPMLPALLPIAMSARSPLSLPDPQDATALENARRAQGVLHGWFDELDLIEIVAPTEGTEKVRAPGVGSFFSGGVDSFHSAIAAQDDITHLIFVVGFDLNLEDEELAERSRAEVRRAAEELGKTLIEVSTNIGTFSNRFVRWGAQYHGAALAAVAHLLSNHLGRVLVPSSYHHDDLFPWGSHPDLDHLWSGANLDLIHHGSSVHRPEKIAAIADNGTAMHYLRVCFENRDGAYNCGSCEKCVRTMVGLRAAGALSKCRTLPAELDLSMLSSRRMGHGALVFARENLAALKASGTQDAELSRALNRVVRLAPVWEVIRKTRRRLRGH